MLNQANDEATGYSLWYIAGKGDWKYKVVWLEAYERFRGTTAGICRRCHAGKPGTSWHDVLYCHGWYDNTEEAINTAFGANIASHGRDVFLNVGYVRFSDLREFADVHFSIYFPVFASLLAKASQAARVVCAHGVRRHSTCAVGWHLS